MTKTFENMPISMMYKFIREKRIKINGKKADIKYKLQEGDIVELYIRDEFLTLPDDEKFYQKLIPEINIVYEDENILLADKKPGMIVHSDEKEELDTLINHITAYLYRKGEYEPEKENFFAPALCNRIDRNTGGIVICAKNAEALRIVNEKIKNDEIEKSYLCLVHGVLKYKEDILTAYHRKDAKNNLVEIRKNEFPGAKIIKTRYKVLKEKNNISLLEVTLITGRTHQIRAHMAYIGHPLVGDGKYGVNKTDRKNGFSCQALYSYHIKFKFKSESDILCYLNGKEFFVDKVEFAENF